MRIGFQRMKRAEGLRAGGESFAFSTLCLESAYTRVRSYFVRFQFGVQAWGRGGWPFGPAEYAHPSFARMGRPVRPYGECDTSFM
jgi:hypothetical protein